MVRECSLRRLWLPSTITCLISLMPLVTAENSMKLALVVSAMILASVVLPTPGGPQKIIELASSRSICTRSGLPGPTRCSWPTNSSRLRGRMRSASGAVPRADSLEESCGRSGSIIEEAHRRAPAPRLTLWRRLRAGRLPNAAATLHTAARWRRRPHSGSRRGRGREW